MISLRGFNYSDAERLVELLQDGKVSERLTSIPHPYTEEIAKDWIRNGPGMPYAIIFEDELVGCVSVTAKVDHYELGYWIGENYQRKGICTAAVEGLLKHPRVKGRCVRARVLKDNAASLRVLEKTNFKIVGETTITNRIGTFDALKFEYKENT